MGISYSTKQKLLDDFSNLDSWKNTFDIDAFIQHRKQWKTKRSPNAPLKNWQFFNSFDIPQSLLESWDIPEHQAISFIKLVIAHDIGLQPELYAFNGVHEKDMRLLLQSIKHKTVNSKNILKEDIAKIITKKLDDKKTESLLEKPWSDPTEFTGNTTAFPTNFTIEKTKNGYSIKTTLEGREDIISCSTIFEQSVTNGFILPSISEESSAKELQSALEKGRESSDHRKEKWLHGIIETSDNTPKIRNTLREKFGLSTGQYALIRYDSIYAVLALRQTALENLQERNINLINSRIHASPKMQQ